MQTDNSPRNKEKLNTTDPDYFSFDGGAQCFRGTLRGCTQHAFCYREPLQEEVLPWDSYPIATTNGGIPLWNVKDINSARMTEN